MYVEHDVEQSAGPGQVNIEWGISGTNAYLPMRSLDENDEGRLKAFRNLPVKVCCPRYFFGGTPVCSAAWYSMVTCGLRHFDLRDCRSKRCCFHRFEPKVMLRLLSSSETPVRRSLIGTSQVPSSRTEPSPFSMTSPWRTGLSLSKANAGESGGLGT